MIKKYSLKIILLILVLLPSLGLAKSILIPMDYAQANHLKAYGLVYWVLERDGKCEWALNYRGGSFILEGYENILNEADLRGISYEIISTSDYSKILANVAENNMDLLKLDKAPKIAVYTPKGKFPWDDAVTLALTYAEIPYDEVWDKEVLRGDLSKYDWLHLHHEDFTGQYGKFYSSYHNAKWYIDQQLRFEQLARELGFKKVSKQKLAVVLKIKEYILGGGFLFAMCSATDSFDIALAAMDTDICHNVFDHDGIDPNYKSKLNYANTLAFKDFEIITNPSIYEFSDIDMTMEKARKVKEDDDYFTLFEFSAKYDPIPTILTQNHTKIIKNFFGQTTSFNRNKIKKGVVILGETLQTDEVKYIHGNFGKGFFTFYGGHDPEDYQHFVSDPPTELELYKNSPGYRLILNNILFPSTNKKKRKT